MLIGVSLDTHADFMPAADVVRLARKIEHLGFESLWLSDAFGREPLAFAAWLLAKTDHLRIGTAVANVYGRDPDSAAQARRTLGEASGGRFMLGLGVSNEYAVAMRKAAWAPPASKMASYLDGLSAASVASAPGGAPVYVAAHGPGLAALGRDKADGIMTWAMPPAHTAAMRELLGRGPHISAQLPVILTGNAALARNIARSYLAVWLGMPSYRAAWGRAAGLEDSDFEAGGSNRLIDALCAWGGASAVSARIREFQQAGATRVILEPLRMADSRTAHVIPGLGGADADWDSLEQLAATLLCA
ncbi:MAG TPA: LLM class flavin-dependent oxidoreductase [Novosphingobium sp.]|nr:LLM class flavin-dependent oxidoreductase [Novosphingobium sp.]